VSTTPVRTIGEFRPRDFNALEGRVREPFFSRNVKYMDRCEGLTVKEDGKVLASWGWILTEPWVAIANDLTTGQLRFVLRKMREWRDQWSWAIRYATVREDDPVARRFAEFMGFEEFDHPLPEIVRYERRSDGY